MRISFTKGIRRGEELEFALPVITVGREHDNVLSLLAVGVSRYHARIRRDELGDWLVEDLGSTNGVLVNGAKIATPTPVKEGDSIEIGAQRFVLSNLDEDTPAPVFTALTPDGHDGAALRTEELPMGDVAAVPEAEPVGGDEKLFSGVEQMFSGEKTVIFDDPDIHTGGIKKNNARVLHYLVVGLLVILAAALWSFYSSTGTGDGAGSDHAAAIVEQDATGMTPLVLEYEKVILSRDNIFRFAMLLEDGKLYFCVDDMLSQRHFEKSDAAFSRESLLQLKSQIEQSGVLSLSNQTAARGTDEAKIVRRLTLVMPDQIKELVIEGKFAPPGFEAMESAISAIAEVYGLQTIALTPDELMAQANSSYLTANKLFDNRDANLENLRDAIKRYKQVVDYLDQFSPHPELWEKATRQLIEAEDLRRRKLENLEYERVRLSSLKDLQGMRGVFIDVMALADEESHEYRTARDRLVKLDDYLRSTTPR